MLLGEGKTKTKQKKKTKKKQKKKKKKKKKLDHEVSICSLIPPAMAISIARTTKGNNSKEPGSMTLIFFPTIQLVILVMCTKFQVSR